MADLSLQIRLRFKDELTKPLTGISGKLLTFGRLGTQAFKGMAGAVFNLRTALVGLVGAYSVWRAVDWVKRTGEQADAMQKLAASTGDVVENLSELQLAFRIGNVDAGKFEAVLRTLLRAQQNGLRTGNEFAAAFESLGISVNELAGLAPSQLFERMAEGLGKLETAQERVVVLSRILPKNYLDALPVIGRGLQEFQATIQEVRRLNGTTTGDQARAANQLLDAITKMQIALEGVGRQLLVSFGPGVAAWLEKVARMIADNRDAILGVAEAIAKTLVGAIGLAVDAVIGLVQAIESIPGVSLIDEAKLQRDIEGLRQQLQLIDRLKALQQGEALNRAREARGELPVPPMPGSTASTIGRGFGQGSAARATVEALLPQEDELRARLAELESTLADGLGGAMKRVREKVAAELQAATDGFRTGMTTGSESGAGPMAMPQLDASTEAVKELGAALTDTGAKAASVFRDSGAEAEAFGVKVRAIEEELADNKEPKGFAGGWEAAIQQVKYQLDDLGRAAGSGLAELTMVGIDGMAAAMGDVITGAKDAKEAFRDFAASFLSDLARMISKMLILAAIKQVFGLESGGVVPGEVTDTMPMEGFAKGGIARRPTLAVFGEGNRSEAFVPLPDNRHIPVEFTGGGGGGGVLNLNITAWDSKDVTRTLLENQSLLRSIWTGQSETRIGLRRAVRRAAV